MHQPPFITSEPNLRHRMIFSANPGRSGSAFLARLLDTSPVIDAGHERDPAMTGPWLRRVAYRGPAESYEDRQIKAAAIRAELTQLADGMIYADTSHLFLKTFADVVLNAFPHELITVIALRRSPLLTARSYFQLGTLGPNRLPWHGWVPFPTAPGMCFRIEPEAVQNQFDLIFGSFVDLVARMNDFRSRTPSVQWIDADLESITSPAGAAALFTDLAIPKPDGLASALSDRVNEKPAEKEIVDLDVSIEHVAARLDDFIDRFGDRPEVRAFMIHHDLAAPSM